MQERNVSPCAASPVAEQIWARSIDRIPLQHSVPAIFDFRTAFTTD
jgi:hypothetical protein